MTAMDSDKRFRLLVVPIGERAHNYVTYLSCKADFSCIRIIHLARTFNC